MANSLDNLKSYKPGEERARENGRKAGYASARAKRERKKLRELAQMILEENADFEGVEMTRGEAALRVQARKAILDGDVKALEFLRDTAGQRPVQGVDINGTLATDQAKFAELLEQLRGNRG